MLSSSAFTVVSASLRRCAQLIDDLAVANRTDPVGSAKALHGLLVALAETATYSASYIAQEFAKRSAAYQNSTCNCTTCKPTMTEGSN